MIGNTEFWKAVGYIVGGAVIVMGKPLWDYFQKKSKILWANEKILSQHSIYRIMTDIRAENHFDRIDITEFTNSENTLNHIPFVFGNMTFEVCAPQIKSIKADYKRFPTSWFAPMYAPLVGINVKSVFWTDNGDYIINLYHHRMKNQSEDLKEEPKHSEDEAGIFLIASKIKSQLIIKFTTMIGDGIITFSSYDDVIKLTKEQYNSIIGSVHQIWYHLKLKR